MEPFIVKTMLQSKLVMDVDIPEMYPQLKVIQKNLVVDSPPKLTCNDWIKEQSEDSDINLIIQLLQSDKLRKYVAREVDSSGIQVLLKYCKDLFLKNALLYQEVSLKNLQGPFHSLYYPKILFTK